MTWEDDSKRAAQREAFEAGLSAARAFKQIRDKQLADAQRFKDVGLNVFMMAGMIQGTAEDGIPIDEALDQLLAGYAHTSGCSRQELEELRENVQQVLAGEGRAPGVVS